MYTIRYNVLSIYLYACLSVYGSTVLLMDLGRFFSFLIYTQTVGLLGRVISPSQGRTYTQNNTNTDIHALSGIRTHNPSVQASEDRYNVQ
jgi:hypothetical protein